jgi:hypothetical protein
MYVYMYVFMYVCMYVCMFVCMYICMYYVCMFVCMYLLCLYVRMYVCMYVCYNISKYLWIGPEDRSSGTYTAAIIALSTVAQTVAPGRSTAWCKLRSVHQF